MDAHRPLRKEHDLVAILSQVEERIVTHDYTIRHRGRIYQIERREIRAGLRGGRVLWQAVPEREGIPASTQGAQDCTA